MSSLSLNTLYPALAPADVPAAEVTGLYVHVPFCFHKCHYCDFYSITRQDASRMGRFVDRMLREAERWQPAGTRAVVRPRTVFFGGGTPTLLPLAEMMRLGTAMGARRDTLAGLSGLGDLILTCTGELSRNRAYGLRIGNGTAGEQSVREGTQIAEGAANARLVRELGERWGVELPIVAAVCRCLYEDQPPQAMVEGLFSRELKAEF